MWRPPFSAFHQCLDCENAFTLLLSNVWSNPLAPRLHLHQLPAVVSFISSRPFLQLLSFESSLMEIGDRSSSKKLVVPQSLILPIIEGPSVSPRPFFVSGTSQLFPGVFPLFLTIQCIVGWLFWTGVAPARCFFFSVPRAFSFPRCRPYVVPALGLFHSSLVLFPVYERVSVPV